MKLKTQKLNFYMAQEGINYSQLSDMTGISRQAISSWINGRRAPMPYNVQKMAEVLKCNIADIAEAQGSLELVALHGDGFAKEVIGMTSDQNGEKYSVESELIPQVLEYVKGRIAKETAFKSKNELGRKLGLSGSQSGRIARGEADLTLMPLSALLRLCPQIIDRGVLLGKPDSKLISFCRDLSAEDQEKALAVLQTIFAK